MAEKISRRDFLKLGGAVAGAIAFPWPFPIFETKKQVLPSFSPEDIQKGLWINWYSEEFKRGIVKPDLDKRTLVKQWNTVSSGVDSAGREGVRVYGYTLLVPKDKKIVGSSLPIVQDVARATTLTGSNLQIVPLTMRNHDGTYIHFPTVVDMTTGAVSMWYGEQMMPTFLSLQSTIDVYGSSKAADLLRVQNTKNLSIGLSGFDILRYAEYLGGLAPQYTSNIDPAVGRILWSPRPLKWVTANSKEFNAKLVSENIRKGPLAA